MTQPMRFGAVVLGLLVGVVGCTSGDDNQSRPTQIRVITDEPTIVQVAQTDDVQDHSITASPVIGEGIVIAQEAIILAEPESSALEVGRLPQDTAMSILEESAPDRIGIIFYRIQTEQHTGWVANTQIQLQTDILPSPTPQARATHTATSADVTASPFPTFTPTQTLAPTQTPTATPIGYPSPEVYTLVLVEQLFEYGRMIWVQPLNEIWVLEGGSIDPRQGTWRCYLDTFQDGQPERDPNLDPPLGTVTASNFDGAAPMQPVRGFGKVWRENFDIREALGWAITPETMHTSRYEYIADGQVQNNRFVAGPGHIELGSLFQYDILLHEDLRGADCEKKAGLWEIR